MNTPLRFPTDLVPLDADHPGFRDVTYRRRRQSIAELAQSYESGEPVPAVDYTDAEQSVWQTVWSELDALHARLVCEPLLERQRDLGLARAPIPQLEDLNRELAAGGFRLEPVAGLVRARQFLERLGDGVFLSTQYVRHASRPLYTPEPDLIHELVGHAASLTLEPIATLSRAFGRAAQRADDPGIGRLERLYWYSLEFGLVVEHGTTKAIGAGLLSSAAELASIEGHGGLVFDWDPERIAATDYDPTDLQPTLFVAPSFEAFTADLADWLDAGESASESR